MLKVTEKAAFGEFNDGVGTVIGFFVEMGGTKRMIQDFVANSLGNFGDLTDGVAKTVEEFGGGGGESQSENEQGKDLSHCNDKKINKLI